MTNAAILGYRQRVAEMLAEAGLNPAHFSETDTDQRENMGRRVGSQWRRGATLGATEFTP